MQKSSFRRNQMELQIIQNQIYELCGVRVMLDRDLAVLYNVETRVLIQATKRNSERFPPEFMFQMTHLEFENWKSQIVISNSVNKLSEDFGKEFDNIYYALSQLAEKPKTEQKRKRIGFDATNEI